MRRSILYIVLATFGSITPMYAASCDTAVQPLINWTKQTAGTHHFPVYVTLTKQSASQNTFAQMDPVFYGTTELGYIVHNGVEALAPISINSNFLLLGNRNGFAVPDPTSTRHNMQLYVLADGTISLQEQLNQFPIGGLPPTIVTPSCTAGLMTVSIGSTAYTLTFIAGTSYTIPG